MTHPATPEPATQEPRVSEQMWAVVQRRDSGDWKLITYSFGLSMFHAASLADQLARRSRFETCAIPVLVTGPVDPGQLEEKEDD